MPTDSEAFLAAVLDAVPMFVIRAGPDLKIRYVNRIVPGLTHDQVIGAHISDFVEPEYRAVQTAAIDRVLATGIAESYAVKGSAADASVAWYETYVTPVTELDGRRGFCLMAVDVSQARNRERALLESEQRLGLALDATGLGLWSLDLVTGEVEWDSRQREILGRDVPTGLEAYFDEVVHPDDRERLRRNVPACLSGGSWPSVTHRIVRPDGESRWVTASGCTLVDDAGRPIRMVGGLLDITAQHDAEEHLRHAQRLDAVGRLTSGVAHNFNNLLMVVSSTLDLLHRRAVDGDRALIEDAREAVGRGSDLVRQLMTFASQRTRAERRACHLAGVVERSVAICQRTFDRHVELDLRIAPDLPAVACTEAEIEQILVNLLLNARDAVLAANRSVPRIAVSVDLGAPTDDGASRAPDGVRVRVTDDGVGMSAEVLAHAFEPFFTTKPMGEGTGLGLATSYAIARTLGGSLGATSQPGHGTTVTLWLPSTDQPVVTAAPSPQVAKVNGAARILLIDDEPLLRRAVAELLEDAGYGVSVAASGDEALEHLAKDRAVDLVLLDRSMPGARVEHSLPRIRELAPDAKVALFTGQEVEDPLRARVDAVIAKPIGADALFEAIGELLTRATRDR